MKRAQGKLVYRDEQGRAVDEIGYLYDPPRPRRSWLGFALTAVRLVALIAVCMLASVGFLFLAALFLSGLSR